MRIAAKRVASTIAKPVFIATLSIAVLFFAAQSLAIATNNSAFTPEELNAVMYITTLDLQQTKQKVLIETESYSYLNILTASNIPEQFILSTGDDPQRIALYVGRKEYIKQNKPQLYQDYIVSKYDFAGNLNPEKLARENIDYVMLENKSHQAAVDNNPNLKPLKNFGNWKIYEFD